MKPFDLVVYAIAAVALVFVALTIMQMVMPKADAERDIRQGLVIAELPSNLGKTITLGLITFDKGVNFSKTAVANGDSSLAFECTTPSLCCSSGEKCARPIEWDPQHISFKQREDIAVSARCIMNFSTAVCKVFFGNTPAQAHVKSVKYLGQTADGYSIQTIVENKGDNELAYAEYTAQVYKKANNEWQLIIDTNAGSIALLKPAQTHTFLWQLPSANIGEYKVISKITTTNGGYDENSVTFTITANRLCTTTTTVGNTFANESGTGFVEEHGCSGCTYAYECQSAWQAQAPQKSWTAGTNSIAYCSKSTIDGSC